MLGFTLVAPLMAIIITGNLLRKYGFYSESDIKTLTKTLYWVILPPLLFRTTFISGKELLVQSHLLISLNLCYIFSIAAAWTCAALFLHRGDRKRIAVSAFACIRSNNIYLGFPVMYLAQGDIGLHNSSVYLAVSTISFQLFSILVGELVMSGKLSKKSAHTIVKRVVTNPLVVACVFGVVAAFLGPDKLPKVLDEPMKLMGNAATAVALLALGGTLDLSRMSRVIRMIRSTWGDILLKVILHPALMYFFLTIFPVPRPLLQATVMLSSMPTAVNCFIVAREMDMDGDYAADIVASTTVLGALTIPIWAKILEII